jgi:hypothetical protein
MIWGEGYCPNLTLDRISEVVASAPTKSFDGEGVLTPEAPGAKVPRVTGANVRAEARPSDYKRKIQIRAVPGGGGREQVVVAELESLSHISRGPFSFNLKFEISNLTP